MCLRDEDGDFVLAKTLCFTRWCPVNVGEVLGLFHALEWLMSDMQSENINLVLDSKMIDAFHSMIVGMQMLQGLAISSQPQGIYLFLILQTLTWSLIDAKQMQFFRPFLGRPHYHGSPIMYYIPFCIILLFLMKCYKHLYFK